VIAKLRDLAHALAAEPMLSRTTGKPRRRPRSARRSPTSSRGSIDSAARSPQSRRRQDQQCGGNYNAHAVAYPDVDWPAFARRLSNRSASHGTATRPQIEPHDGIASSPTRSAAQTPVLIDFARDVWGNISLATFGSAQGGEVGSSTCRTRSIRSTSRTPRANFGIANALFAHFSEKSAAVALATRSHRFDRARALGTAFGHTEIALEALLRGVGKLNIDSARLAAISMRVGKCSPKPCRP